MPCDNGLSYREESLESYVGELEHEVMRLRTAVRKQGEFIQEMKRNIRDFLGGE